MCINSTCEHDNTPVAVGSVLRHGRGVERRRAVPGGGQQAGARACVLATRVWGRTGVAADVAWTGGISVLAAGMR